MLLKLYENQLALEASIMELQIWVEQRGSPEVAENIRGALHTIDENEECIKLTLAILSNRPEAAIHNPLGIGMLTSLGQTEARHLRDSGDLKMEKTLSSTFMRTKGKPISFNGKTVVAIIEIKITEPRTVFSVRRLGATNGRVQGLALKIMGGKIVVEGSGNGCPEIVLWSDTSPDALEIEVFSKGGNVLKIWNVWKSAFGMNAWVGNAGIHVHGTDGTMTLECSDGVGDVDFSDYVVVVEKR